MNNQAKQDLKNLKNWLNMNKICESMIKTETILLYLTV